MKTFDFRALAAGMGLAAVIGFTPHAAVAAPNAKPPVIEVATVKLKDGVTPATFAPVDRLIERTYISKRPGFLSRESAPGPDGSWLVIVHWRSAADADASMKNFASAPAASQFMSMIVPSTMTMTRYSR